MRSLSPNGFRVGATSANGPKIGEADGDAQELERRRRDLDVRAPAAVPVRYGNP